MKPFHLIASLALGVLLSACNQPASTSSQPPAKPPPPASEPSQRPDSVPAPETAPAPVSASPPAPALAEAAPPKVEPPAPPKVLAPEGILFALERITVTTADGVFSIPPGARLRIVRKQPDGYVVSESKREFVVEVHQVTNEMDAAAAASQIHVAERSADAAAARAQAVVRAESYRAQQSLDAATAKKAAREKRRQDLQARRTALTAEIANLTAKIEQSEASQYRAYYHLYSRIGTITVDPGLRISWKQRLAVATEEKRMVDEEFFALGRLRD